MNSRERVIKAIGFEDVDRVPVFAELLGYAAKLNNITYEMFASNPNLLAASLIKTLKVHSLDGIYVSSHYVVAEALGCKTVYLDDKIDQSSKQEEMLVQSSNDLVKLNNFNPSIHKGTLLIKRATEIIKGELGDKYAIKPFIGSGPMQLAALLRGMERIMVDLYDNEQLVYDLFDLCTDAVIKNANFLIKAKPDLFSFGDSTAGLISRDLYKKYAFPFEKKLIEEVKKLGIPVFMHICGNSMHIIDLMAKTGADVLELDYKNDIKKCREIMGKDPGNNPAIQGNINPVAKIMNGTYDEIYKESAELIRDLEGLKGGFILSPGCEVPPYTPSENIDAMVKASKDSGCK